MIGWRRLARPRRGPEREADRDHDRQRHQERQSPSARSAARQDSDRRSSTPEDRERRTGAGCWLRRRRSAGRAGAATHQIQISSVSSTHLQRIDRGDADRDARCGGRRRAAAARAARSRAAISDDLHQHERHHAEPRGHRRRQQHLRAEAQAHRRQAPRARTAARARRLCLRMRGEELMPRSSHGAIVRRFPRSVAPIPVRPCRRAVPPLRRIP